MSKIGFAELSLEKFKKYGSYTDLLNPSGVIFGDKYMSFYRDLVQGTLGKSNIASYSICLIKKRKPAVINISEYHNYCSETIIPLNGDILMHVGPATASDIVPVEDIEVFRIPKCTLVKLNPGVWHHMPFTYNCDFVSILVVLPERSYMNDCHVIKLPDDIQIELND
ncbi:MAG: ureidoglycolate lyase [Actinobacteria bacterium]|nr:ureidoglycolate lyase [Actinomycetota bacterium]